MRSRRQQKPRGPVLHRFCLASVRIFLPLVALLIWICFAPDTCYGAYDLPNYFQQNYGSTFTDAREFYAKFPYDQYLKQTKFNDFPALQKDRLFLYTKFGDGDEFLYRLGEEFLNLYPLPPSPTLADLNNKIDIGEQYLNPNKGLNRPVNEIYIIIGYFILNKVAASIGEQIRAKKYDENEPNRARIIQRLGKDRVYVSREESAAAKLASYISQHRWKDLWYRFCSIIHSHAEKLWPILIGATVVSIFFFLVGFMRRFRRLRALGLVGLILASGPIAILKFETPAAQAATKRPDGGIRGPTTTNLQLITRLNLQPKNNGSSHGVVIYTLKLNGAEIGQVVWMDRDAVQASYISYENVPAKYQQFRSTNHVVLATTGGYTNTSHQPEGFTTENGNMVNPVIMPDRDGIAMFRNGGINVLDIDLNQPDSQLPGGPTIKNPLKSLLAYADLVKWCRAQKATMFQTHLLAYGDAITIDPAKAPAEIRERRILALASDRKTGKVSHVIFNVTQPFTIAQMANEIFGLLQSHNLKVEAILNLDVGAFNILEVYDDNGKLLNDLKGPVDISTATNLLVYKS